MVTNELLNYVARSYEARVPIEQIVNTLHTSGWNQEDIQAAVAKVTNPVNSTIPVTTSLPAQVSKIGTLNNANHDYSALILRFGLAFVFFYAALFVSSSGEIGGKYVPAFIGSLMPVHVFLILFSIYEVLLALWLLSGFFVKYSALLAVVTLTSITIFNLSFFGTLFRNVAIISAALALLLNALTKDKNRKLS